MEALTDSPVASPALYQLVLSVLGAIDTWASDPARAALTQLVEQADDDEVALIPHSVGAVLPLLAGSPDRLNVALDAITRFDLFEAANGLSVLVWQGNRKAVLAGSALVPHPAVPESFRDLVGAHRQDLTNAWETDLFLTRVNVGHLPETEAARVDRMVRWLPVQASESRFAAAAVQPPSAEFSPRDHLRLVIDLVSAGIVVRRLPNFESRRDAWVPGWVPVIGPRAPLGRFKFGSPVTALERQRIVERTFAISRHAWRAKHAFAPQQRLAPLEVTSIETFDDGAIPRREVAYLSGLRRTQFESLRRYDSLLPLHFRGLNYWTFSQLVGMRAARYLFHISDRRRGLGDVANRLVRLARENQQVPVAITKAGNVLVRDSGALYDVETGQVVDEDIISLVDEVYEPFPLEGSVVPRLLRPSQHVAVHPGIVRGLPHVAGTRVTVGAVAKALSAARHSRHDNPITFAADSFGIDSAQVRDAERVANSVNAVL